MRALLVLSWPTLQRNDLLGACLVLISARISPTVTHGVHACVLARAVVDGSAAEVDLQHGQKAREETRLEPTQAGFQKGGSTCHKSLLQPRLVENTVGKVGKKLPTLLPGLGHYV